MKSARSEIIRMKINVHPIHQELISRILKSDETSHWLKDAIKTLFNRDIVDSIWLKDAIKTLFNRDIVDSINDVELLLSLLNKELNAYQDYKTFYTNGKPRLIPKSELNS